MSNALVVAPSWVGDAILSEPLIARLQRDATIDVLAPAWCAPVYARIRGVRRIHEHPFAHGELALRQRRTLARSLRVESYARAYVLPNSFKAALVPWLARIPARIGYLGEARYLLLTDARRLDTGMLPRLVDRFVALGLPRGAAIVEYPPPVLVPDAANRGAALRTLGLEPRGARLPESPARAPDTIGARVAGSAPAGAADPHALQRQRQRPLAILCPGAEYGPAKRWPAGHFATLARRFAEDGHEVWLIGSAKDREATTAIAQECPDVRDLAGQSDLGTAIDLISLADIVVSNDSGLMHVAAAVGVPLVGLFGSSSPAYTPPLSPRARVARIEIECSPCFARVCPLGHFRCMRELAPELVYDLSRKLSSAVLTEP